MTSTTSLATVPHWARPTPDPPRPMTIGINVNAQFYPYDSQIILPELRGAVTGLRLIQQAAKAQSGPRDYLEVSMISDVPMQPFRLCLPADERPVDGSSGHASIPNSVRTLLGALLTIDLTAQAIRLTAKKGDGRAPNRRPTFIDVCACGPDWEALAPVRAEPIGRSKDDMITAVAQINQSLQAHHELSRLPSAHKEH